MCALIPAASPAASAHSLAKPSYVLENRVLSVSLGDHGIRKIYDKIQRKPYFLQRDSFSITINDQTFSPSSLHLEAVRQTGNKLTYGFECKDYRIAEVFTLKPGWRFVSKQLFVTPARKGAFTVNRVQVLAERFNEPILDRYIPKSRYPYTGAKDYGAFLRFSDSRGLLALVQNPFLNYQQKTNAFTLTYAASMEWRSSDGPFASDAGCLGPYALSGRHVPVRMIPEWQWTKGQAPPAGPYEYQSEVLAFTQCVNAFVQDHAPRPLDVQVGWTENDYQIDVSTASGREVYKRILNRAAQIGAQYLLYQPANTLLGNFLQASDNWHVENRLWLGLGIQIRKDQWNPRTDPLPASIRAMLQYAAKKQVKLVAYVYPILPFAQDRRWLVTVNQGGHRKRYANLGDRHFQKWLIDELSAFKQRTGVGGFSFDYAFLNLPGKSTYAQWRGWKNVMQALRKRFPDIVMDGRQSYQDYGPWTWLAGSYPHPTSTDEQPESFVPFPDLHFDRVSADRERYTAYRYRVREYCPQVLMPGFIGHQTDRFNDRGQHIRQPFRRRDWDELGWKYSLISSIGYAGMNNVINMIPARDPEEYRHFPKQDVAFFRKWLAWTGTHRDALERTMPILGQPAIGKIDGTSAILKDRGFLFFFNPNGRAMEARVKLDASIGLTQKGKYLIREKYPVKGLWLGKPRAGCWGYGDEFSLPVDGCRAVVLKIIPFNPRNKRPILFNATGQARVQGNRLSLAGVKGEVGTDCRLLAYLPSAEDIQSVRINGQVHRFIRHGHLVEVAVRFAGQPFHHMQQVGRYDPHFTGGAYSATFSIPQRIFDQLRARAKRYPIPWTAADHDTPWLVPQRLPLFVQIAQPKQTMKVEMKLNGRPVPLVKAYSSVRPYARDFVGYYADCSRLKPDKSYQVNLRLPNLEPGRFQGLFFDNVATAYTSRIIREQSGR